jgi:ATP-binding cassette subfamily C protein
MRNTVEKLRKLFSRGEKIRLLGIIVLMTVMAALEIVGLGLLMPLVALFTKPVLLEQNRYLRFMSDWSLFADRNCFLICICAAAVAVYLFKTLLSLLVIRLQSRFIARKQRDLCDALYHKVMNSPYEFHLVHGSGELVTMMSRTVDLGTELLFPLMLLLTDLVTVAALSLVLVVLMPVVTFSCVAVLTLLGAAVYFPLRSLNARVGREQSQGELESRRRMLSGFFGAKAAKAMRREEFFTSSYSAALDAWLPLRAKLFELGQLPRLSMELIAIVTALGVFAAMALAGVPAGTLLLSFSMLLAAMSRLLPAFSRIHYNLIRVLQNRYAFDSVMDWLTIAEEPTGEGASPLTFNDRIEFRNVTFAYPGRSELLFRDFSLTIPVRASVAFTGVTGGGKSTLADILLGLLTPSRGGVFVDGRDIRENLASWRSRVGFVPQHIYLLDDTIGANVAFGAPGGIDPERVAAALKMAQLADFVAALPDGADTVIGENGVRLSGGQRQRLGIARALYGNPELLVLDEATSALDYDTEQALVSALDTLRGKLTIVTIAHRLSTVEKCDFRVCVGPKEDR